MIPERALSLALLAVLVPACATPRPEPGPEELTLAHARADATWRTVRRGQLDRLFDRIVAAPDSGDALQWLRVYVLSQVADEKDRDTRGDDAALLSAQLKTVADTRSRAKNEFADDIASLQAEVTGLRALLARSAAPAAPVAAPAAGTTQPAVTAARSEAK
jgi:hypothetical protein